jgi:hypothetical protein
MAKRRSRGDGSVYQRNNGLWVAQISLLNGKRKSSYWKTQKEAREWLKKQQRDLADGTIIADERTKLGDFIDRWFNDIASHSLRPLRNPAEGGHRIRSMSST